jgi:DNA (cytosine-5)-methyltransferase 1
MGIQRRSPSVRIGQACSWSQDRKTLEQVVTVGRRKFSSSVFPRGRTSSDAAIAWEQSLLRGGVVRWPATRRRLRAVDLFCAAGGMSLGMRYAARAIGIDVEIALAADADADALAIYAANHHPAVASVADVQSLVSYKVIGRGAMAKWGGRPSLVDAQLRAFLEPVDILIAGPPCQGHSSFNNRTRRNDARNLLYVTTAAFAVASRVRLCVIENVPDVQRDKYEVVKTARSLLESEGYSVSDAVLSASEFGVGQRRRRHFLVAVRGAGDAMDLPAALQGLTQSSMTLRRAIGDLSRRKGGSIVDSVGTLSQENQTRINWLFYHDAYDLPDKQRPDCHRNGHTYPSVYGRMKWDEPAQTITTGFLCPGRGRYVHPSNRRTVTPREAARIQGFPDSYDFCPAGMQPTRSLLGKVIGDAVPPPLARAVCLAGLYELGERS